MGEMSGSICSTLIGEKAASHPLRWLPKIRIADRRLGCRHNRSESFFVWRRSRILYSTRGWSEPFGNVSTLLLYILLSLFLLFFFFMFVILFHTIHALLAFIFSITFLYDLYPFAVFSVSQPLSPLPLPLHSALFRPLSCSFPLLHPIFLICTRFFRSFSSRYFPLSYIYFFLFILFHFTFHLTFSVSLVRYYCFLIIIIFN